MQMFPARAVRVIRIKLYNLSTAKYDALSMQNIRNIFGRQNMHTPATKRKTEDTTKRSRKERFC